MKRISFPGGSIVTGSAVANELLKYLPVLTRAGESRAVRIPVREPDGTVSEHSLTLTPSTMLDVADCEGMSQLDEAELFPVPHLPAVGRVARSESSEVGETRARALDRAITDFEQ